MDLETGTLSVRRTLCEAKEKGLIFEAPKNGKGRRIKLNGGAAEALRGHLERQLREIDRLGSLYQDRGLIFPSERGTTINAMLP